MRLWRHRIAGALFPRYSLRIDQANYNARLGEWLKTVPKIPVFHDRGEFYRYLNHEILGNCSIDYLEFGVFEGESIANWAEINTNAASRFFGFDSFRGLPEAWNTRVEAGRFNVDGKAPETDDPRVSFVEGWFNDTLTPFLTSFKPASRLVVHNDADLYSSTLYCLTRLDDLLVPGSVVIFDELFSALHEFRALRDYSTSYRRRLEPVARMDDVHGRFAFVFA